MFKYKELELDLGMALNQNKQKAQFGKYKGKLISWIQYNDPKYLDWLLKSSNSQTKTKRSAQSLIDKNKLK